MHSSLPCAPELRRNHHLPAFRPILLSALPNEGLKGGLVLNWVASPGQPRRVMAASWLLLHHPWWCHRCATTSQLFGGHVACSQHVHGRLAHPGVAAVSLPPVEVGPGWWRGWWLLMGWTALAGGGWVGSWPAVSGWWLPTKWQLQVGWHARADRETIKP